MNKDVGNRVIVFRDYSRTECLNFETFKADHVSMLGDVEADDDGNGTCYSRQHDDDNAYDVYLFDRYMNPVNTRALVLLDTEYRMMIAYGVWVEEEIPPANRAVTSLDIRAFFTRCIPYYERRLLNSGPSVPNGDGGETYRLTSEGEEEVMRYLGSDYPNGLERVKRGSTTIITDKEGRKFVYSYGKAAAYCDPMGDWYYNRKIHACSATTSCAITRITGENTEYRRAYHRRHYMLSYMDFPAIIDFFAESGERALPYRFEPYYDTEKMEHRVF